MRAAVAFSELPDSRSAAGEAARAAQASLGAPADLVLLFATARHDVAELRAGLRQELGEHPRLLVGGAVGVITSHAFGYAGSQLGLALIHAGDGGLSLLSEGGMDEDEADTGRRLGVRLCPMLAARRHAAALLFYDAKSQRNGRGRLNMATPLLKGLAEACGNLPPLVGAGLIGDMAGSLMPQVVGDTLCSQQAVALVLDGVTMDTAIMHGCQPASDYVRVTRADGNLVYELDHRPALDVVAELLGHTVPPEDFAFFATLGVNQGDKWGAYDEAAYMNRLCLKADLKRGALVMFEPDLSEGTEVQLMMRSLNLDYIAPRVESLFSGLHGRRPVLALYINCAGRAAAYSGQEREDAVEVQRAVAGRVPLLGFYSGVEIGMVLGRPMPLDWTGVFCLLSVPEAQP